MKTRLFLSFPSALPKLFVCFSFAFVQLSPSFSGAKVLMQYYSRFKQMLQFC